MAFTPKRFLFTLNFYVCINIASPRPVALGKSWKARKGFVNVHEATKPETVAVLLRGFTFTAHKSIDITTVG